MLAKTLDQRHPTYNADTLAAFDALYEGGADFEARRSTFLPTAPLESSDRYTVRMTFATYTNHAGPLVDMIAAWLFSRPPVVDGLDGWDKDVDGKGTDWAAWWREPFLDALQDGRGFVWVNLPKRDGAEPTNRAEEEALGLTRPFLVDLDADTVINWRDDDRGNLAAVMLRTEVTDQVDLLAPARNLIRWTYIDATEIRRWEWEKREGLALTPETVVAEVLRFDHGFKRLPVVRLALPAGLHAMGKLHDPAVALLRTEHDQDWALRVSAHPLLTLTTSGDGLTLGETRKPVIGTGAYAVLVRDANGSDAAAYVEPSGISYEARAKHIEQQLDALHRVVDQMATAQSADAAATGGKSGAAKAMDWKALAIMLSAYAEILRTAMEQTLDLVAIPMSIDRATLSVSGMTGWDEGDILTVIAQFVAAFPEIKSPTFRKLAAKAMAHRLLPDAGDDDLLAIDKEIDAADYADPELYPVGGYGGKGANEDGAAAK